MSDGAAGYYEKGSKKRPTGKSVGKVGSGDPRGYMPEPGPKQQEVEIGYLEEVTALSAAMSAAGRSFGN